MAKVAPTSPLPSASSRLARQGLFVTALLLGLGLSVTAWVSWRGAAALVGTVSQGQAEHFLQALRERSTPFGPPSSELLATFLREHEAEGLRALTVLEPDEVVLATAGQRS